MIDQSISIRAAGWMASLMILGGAILNGQTVQTSPYSSLTDLNIELTETKLTLDTVTEENRTLREQLRAARQSISALTESLAIANTESEVFRTQVIDLTLRMEALGLDAVGTDKQRLEQRLLRAVQDLQLAQEEKEKITGHLLRLNEALIRYLKTASSEDAEARMELESELREVSKTLNEGMTEEWEDSFPIGQSLLDGMIISIKEEYSLVVANMGSAQGVRIGMPFEVWRDKEQIGVVRVVDVRENISGAVIQNLDETKGKLKVGDRLRVETR